MHKVLLKPKANKGKLGGLLDRSSKRFSKQQHLTLQCSYTSTYCTEVDFMNVYTFIEVSGHNLESSQT